MLTAERNELLTRVGRGTPAGERHSRAADRRFLVAPRELSLPDAVAMAQKDPAKTVSTP